jgi:molybdate transport system substrate-binding protein
MQNTGVKRKDRMKFIIVRLMMAMLVLLAPHLAMAAPPNVAAASDLKFVLEELAATFEMESGHKVGLTFGSSGVIATQIRNGAPFQLYLSADEDYALKLHADGYTQDEGSLYAIGRIALLAPKGSSLPLDAELKGLATMVRAGQLKRFAIANPEHAPYGKRAVEVLKKVGIWEAMQTQVVYGENVSQAAQFAVSGSADGGIVALSLVMSPQFASLGRYALIPAEWHSPLKQRMVLMKGASPTARAFYAFLQTPAARSTFKRYGFILPGDA